MLEAKNLSYQYKSVPVLRQVSLKAAPSMLAVIGPNAAGKSTFIKCLAGLLRPSGGVLIEGLPIDQWEKDRLADILGYLPQESNGKAVLTVFEAVLLGRLAKLSWRVNDADLAAVLEILRELGLEHLSTTALNELSGGQQQMVSIAQALVKHPRILLMDEPTNSLDLNRQLEVFELLTRLTEQRKLTSIIALHDLNLAARFADQLIVLHKGEVYASGKPHRVLTEALLRRVYGVEAVIVKDCTGVPQIIPIRAARPRKSPVVDLTRREEPAHSLKPVSLKLANQGGDS
jgi:iron complex transport system ATP-binding protein